MQTQWWADLERCPKEARLLECGRWEVPPLYSVCVRVQGKCRVCFEWQMQCCTASSRAALLPLPPADPCGNAQKQQMHRCSSPCWPCSMGSRAASAGSRPSTSTPAAGRLHLQPSRYTPTQPDAQGADAWHVGQTALQAEPWGSMTGKSVVTWISSWPGLSGVGRQV